MTSAISRQLYGVTGSNTHGCVAVEKGTLTMQGLDALGWHLSERKTKKQMLEKSAWWSLRDVLYGIYGAFMPQNIIVHHPFQQHLLEPNIWNRNRNSPSTPLGNNLLCHPQKQYSTPMELPHTILLPLHWRHHWNLSLWPMPSQKQHTAVQLQTRHADMAWTRMGILHPIPLLYLHGPKTHHTQQ